jgi:hypothetical protein
MTAVQMTKQGKEWINPSQRFATAFAAESPEME